MNSIDVTMVRIYISEGKASMEHLVKHLHDVEKVRGVTVFRGIIGFGKHGKVHSSALLDMSLDLPLVVEFFDEPARIDAVLEHLNTLIEPGHLVSWQARLNV
jgi:PII-like signaling protein